MMEEGAPRAKARWLNRAWYLGAEKCSSVSGERQHQRTQHAGHFEEFGLNLGGDRAQWKCLEETSGSICLQGEGEQSSPGGMLWARIPLGEAGREGPGSDPGAPARWGPGGTACLLSAQQQDDLGAAFQTWLDTSGALRAEVPPGALPTALLTQGPFLGGGGCRDDDPYVVSGLQVTHAEQFMASK